MTLNQSELQDMMGVHWLKKQIDEWVGQEVVDLVKGVECTENYYCPNNVNKKYILEECDRFMEFYRAKQNVTQQVYWRSTIEVIKAWNKVSPDVIQSIHTLNWLEKNS